MGMSEKDVKIVAAGQAEVGSALTYARNRLDLQPEDSSENSAHGLLKRRSPRRPAFPGTPTQYLPFALLSGWIIPSSMPRCR